MLVLNEDVITNLQRWYSCLVCSFSFSQVLVMRHRMAFSLRDHALRHSGCTDGLLNLEQRLTKEKASLIGRPNTISAGDMLQSGSGVLRIWSMARRKLSLSNEPVEPIFSIRMRFAYLTATSARPLDCG